jgi:hypothetical protein
VERIRARWPKAKIVVRGDSGFCREGLMAWCEKHGVDYIFGLAKNGRLIEAIAGDLETARARFDETGHAARVFREFAYRTRETWSRPRRVIAKAEHLEKGANPRFIVTSLDGEARALYEKVYCARGDMENRIKEQQLYLFADRTSAATMRANRIRLWFASLAYTLLHLLRHLGLKGTSLARAQCHMIRLKLLKIGARLRVTARRIWISFTEACPYAGVLRRIVARLERLPRDALLTRRRGLRRSTASRTFRPHVPKTPCFLPLRPPWSRQQANPSASRRDAPSRCAATTADGPLRPLVNA